MNHEKQDAATSLADLDALADSFADTKSIVDKWLKPGDYKKLSKRSLDPPNVLLARPPRLGIGAKPSEKVLAHDSIFGNYQLKMQLTGKEKLGGETTLPKHFGSKLLSGGKRSAAPKPLRPLGTTDDDESRSKSIGKRGGGHSVSSSIPSNRGRKKRKNN